MSPSTAPAPVDARPARLLRLAVVGAAALVLVAALALASQHGARTTPARGAKVAGAPEVQRLFAGIPQRGNVLGSPRAPVTLVEYADLQCPYCARFAVGALPAIVDRYVRTGRVRLELRLLRFIGPDSRRAARAALAAAAQDRLWQFSELFYRNQGRENSGYVTSEHLLRLMQATPGLRVGPAARAAASPQVERALARFEASTRAGGIDSTPSFLAGPTGGRLEPLQVGSLEPGAFTEALDRLARAR